MAGNGGVARRCAGRRSYAFREMSFFERRKTRMNLRNVSMILLFKKPLFYPLWRSLSGNYRILSMDAREKSRSTILESSKQKRVPVFVMMPVNAFSIDSSGSPRIRKRRDIY